MPERRRRRPARKSQAPLLILIAILIAVLVGLFVLTAYLGQNTPPADNSQTSSQESSSSSSSSDESDTPAPPPPVVKEATATFSATGDMLMHMPVVNTGRQNGSSDYVFDNIFRYFASYVQDADYAMGNLETTLAGLDNGYGYSGYPNFNCPDGIITGMKDAGFDMVLTANNHSYDTKTIGLTRTVETILQQQLAVLGTKADAEDPNYIIVEKNGIKIAISCYTYETDGYADKKALNGHSMLAADAPLINSFDYKHLDLFYNEISENMEQMKAEGADAYILFVHWGNEYQTTQNSIQSEMAQKLCDLGVDVIIGGHPHVIQPVELLTSTVDESKKTVCLYSMGNAVSNQRLGNISYVKTAHTEDGVLFSVTFARYSDGTVILESADLLPTWVNLGTNPQSGKWEYNIIPLDKDVEDWKTEFFLSDTTLKKAQDSYDRTMAIVGDGMTAVSTYLRDNVLQVEAALGVE